jgi:hypothetical protein
MSDAAARLVERTVSDIDCVLALALALVRRVTYRLFDTTTNRGSLYREVVKHTRANIDVPTWIMLSVYGTVERRDTFTHTRF